jgi:hypothetical protein
VVARDIPRCFAICLSVKRYSTSYAIKFEWTGISLLSLDFQHKVQIWLFVEDKLGAGWG